MCVWVYTCFSHVSLLSHGLKPARLLLSMRFSRQECWSRLPCRPPDNLPDPGTEPSLL